MEKKTILRICLLAFLIPFLIMGLAFVKLKIYPFGDQQVLVIDAWHQYYPFLVELHRKVREGESLLHSWRVGMGSDFMAVIAYTLASPLNLIAVFMPESWLREIFALMTLVKVGCSGSFCAFALYKMNLSGKDGEEEAKDGGKEAKNGGNSYGILIFSTFYALCGWLQGYYWNIMFLDSFAVFPLVALGIRELVREKKYRLYTISLAAAILFNFYIGLLICIFTAFFFFMQCAIYCAEFKELWRNLKNIILFSAVALMISAVCWIPAFITLQNASAGPGFPGKPELERGWAEVLSGMFAYGNPSLVNLYGGPYLYSGVLSVLFLFVFFRLRGVRKKEKAAYLCMILFLLISMNVNVLNYLWHGFRITHGIPYRFSFMFSFLAVVMAYRAYTAVDTLRKKDCLIAGAASMACFFFVAADQIFRCGKENGCGSLAEIFAAGGSALREFLLKNFLIIAAYFVILFLMVQKKLKKKWCTLMLVYIAGIELVSTATINDRGWTTDRDSYPDRYREVREALAHMEEQENKKSFYRTELMSRCVLNPAELYDYRGVTLFSSTANAAVAGMFKNMGLPQWDNGYYYQNTTPVNNMFLNLKYLIARGEEDTPDSECLTEAVRVEDVVVYRNEAYLPIGFMVEAGMQDISFEGCTPVERQNVLLKTAAGIKEDVFEPLEMIRADYENVDVGMYDDGIYHYQPSEEQMAGDEEPENEKFEYGYKMPKDGSAYIFMNLEMDDSANNTAMVEFGDRAISYDIYSGGNFFPAGTYKKDDVFSVYAETNAGKSGDLRIYAGILNQDVLRQAYGLLKDETLEVTDWNSGYLKGTIAVKKDNLLYTSIPCEKGWKVYVDGERKDITLAADAFLGVMLTKGEHTVEFVYSPAHVYLAAVVSLAGTGIFILIVGMDKKGKWKCYR